MEGTRKHQKFWEFIGVYRSLVSTIENSLLQFSTRIFSLPFIQSKRMNKINSTNDDQAVDRLYIMLWDVWCFYRKAQSSVNMNQEIRFVVNVHMKAFFKEMINEDVWDEEKHMGEVLKIIKEFLVYASEEHMESFSYRISNSVKKLLKKLGSCVCFRRRTGKIKLE